MQHVVGVFITRKLLITCLYNNQYSWVKAHFKVFFIVTIHMILTRQLSAQFSLSGLRVGCLKFRGLWSSLRLGNPPWGLGKSGAQGTTIARP
jgi:hypothetical protein